MTHKDTDSLDASQPRCIDMPNDEPEGHYWSWVHAPHSIPNDYRECMTCGRIDASEFLEKHTKAVLQTVLELQELAWVKRGDVESHENIINANKVQDLIHRIQNK
jgi:hypothetical protein